MLKFSRALFATLVCLSLVTAGAQAATFSFAADDNDDGFSIGYGGGGQNYVGESLREDYDRLIQNDFIVDINGQPPGGITTFPNATFEFDALITEYAALAFAGSVVHHWTLGGPNYRGGPNFVVKDASGVDILTINFSKALMTSYSSSFATMGRSATIHGNVDTDPGLTFIAGPALTAATGLTSADLLIDEDFALTLTAIHPSRGGGAVPLIDLPQDDQTSIKVPEEFAAEVSFSAEALPEPASLALLGIGTLVLLRSRRG